MSSYVELHCLSNFTFLRGASHPEELLARAASLGYSGLALTDECSVAGVVRAHVAARLHGVPLIFGTELRLTDGPKLVLLATSRAGYGGLCELISQGRRAAVKGSYCLSRNDLASGALDECLALWLPEERPIPSDGEWLSDLFPERCWIAVELLATGRDRARLAMLTQLGARLRLRCVASGDVHMHVRGRRALQDTLTAIRLKTTVASAGLALLPNGERHLRRIASLERVYPPALLEESIAIAQRCRFSLDELRYEYPQELVPEGETPASHLRKLTEEGQRIRWPEGVPDAVRTQIEHELELIAELRYEPFFLTVHDLVRFARSHEILCQGRGSAANSAVCYCLGITAVDPARMNMLFERFLSRERNEPPDIDVDFEHERREEVIQYIYGKYGRERAALAATVICYRSRSALRDVGKALGFDPAQIERLSGAVQWWDDERRLDERVREAGFDPASPQLARLLVLVRTLVGFPRHLSQHVGGFVIARDALARLVPIENATMPERTVIQWDKNDLEELGLLKVDVLGLGMLTAIRRCFGLVERFSGRRLALADVPPEDSAVYDMICHADTIGVFQIESRAQMSMLPRLRPRCYYDLVIEVAIIRPGPIQGDMVHPYLRRRNGEEAVDYPRPVFAAEAAPARGGATSVGVAAGAAAGAASAAIPPAIPPAISPVQRVLERTLGVPIFQEQVMHLAMVAAGFTPGEADQLRRAMAAWSRRGHIGGFEERLVAGMRARGYPEEYAQRLFRQILGFGEYGFPESHAASFALLVYISAWLKHYEPASFTAALLNSQPMGFYAPAQLVQDARRHGVEVRAVDVRSSDWDCTLEPGADGKPALRLGLRQVKSFSAEGATRLVAARRTAAFRGVQDLAERARLDRGDLAALAAADALTGLAGHRHRARWEVAGVEPTTPLIEQVRIAEGVPLLRAPREGENIVADYASVGLTLRRHPLALLRDRLKALHLCCARELHTLPHGLQTRTAGIVVTRQRPGSASGVTFVTLEDETGHVNLIVWRQVAERYRRALIGARLLGASGTLQREGEVLHLVVARLYDYSRLLGDLTTRSRDFH